MEHDKKLLEKLIMRQQEPLNYEIILNHKRYPLSEVTISKTATSVTKPTMRGGVYHSDIDAFKIIGTIDDLSIVPFLSKSMLGPNAEFQELEVKTNFFLEGKMKDISIFTNLTNTMQNSSQIKLNLIILRTKIKSDN